MGILSDIFTLKRPQLNLEVKKAFDAARYGVAGVPAYPDHDRESLMGWSRKNEVVYACINKKCQVACDPEVIVEKMGKEWETVEGHPLTALIEKPNPVDTFDTFMQAWIASEEITGDFYAEIVRDKGGVPIQLWPLDPSCMFPIPDAKGAIAYYEFRSGHSPIIRLEIKDVLHRRKPDLNSRYYGLSPLRVALGSVDADQSQTDFTRAFFHSDGIPAGLLRVLNRNMTEEEANSLQQRWMTKYRRGGSNHKQVAVLDQNAEFQTIGSSLAEIESAVTRGQIESRICMVFGVPPALIGAYVGMDLATNDATLRSLLEDFWINTMSPLMKGIRVYLTWQLLPEFESIDLIKAKKIRVNWDMSQVMALQEDEDQRHDRARKNFTCGGWSINEFREATGMEPLDGDDYFIQPKNVDVLTEAIRLLLAEREPPEPPDPNQMEEGEEEEQPDPKLLTDGKGMTWYDFSGPHSYSKLRGPHPMPVEVAGPITDGHILGSLKTYDYNGLTLGREPTEVEKRLDLKGMVEAYENESKKIARILTGIRDDLIEEASHAVKDFDAGSIYTLVLTPPVQANKKLRKEVENAVEIGRAQVAKELGGLKALELKERGRISEFVTKLVDILISRTVNEIQTRVANLFAVLGTLGLDDEEITAKLKSSLNEQSLKVFESFATQTANAAINAGRDAEAQDRKDEWVRVEYSAILDKNTCDECSDADGKSATDVSDLPEAPNPDCEGGAQCRCFHIYVGDEEQA